MNYLASGRERSNADLFLKKIINSNLRNYGENIMLYEESLRQDGAQRGEQKGAHNAQQKIVNNMLHAGIKPQEVAKMTGIPLKEVERIQKSISH